MRRCWRHESLRTIFPDTLGVPRQVILEASAARPRLAVEAVSEAALAGALAGAARQGFDLASSRRCGCICLCSATPSMCCFCYCTTLQATAGRLLRWRAILARPTRRGPRQSAGAAGAAGAVCRLHAVAAQVLGQRGRSAECDCAPAVVLDQCSKDLPDQIELPGDRPRQPSPATAATASGCTSTPSCTAVCWGWPATARRACSWCCRRRWRRC